MRVSELETNLDKSPNSSWNAPEPSTNCSQRPHYFLAIVSGFVGFLCLGLALGLWQRVAGVPADAGTKTFFVGLAFLAACLFFVYQSFTLAVFGVSPCVNRKVSNPAVTGLLGFVLQVGLDPLHDRIVVRTKLIDTVVLTALAESEAIEVAPFLCSGFNGVNVFTELRNMWLRIREGIQVICPAEKIALTFGRIGERSWHVLNAGDYRSLGANKTSRESRLLSLFLEQKIFFRQFSGLSRCNAERLNCFHCWSIPRVLPFSVETEDFTKWNDFLYADHRVNHIVLNSVVDDERPLHAVQRVSADSVGFNHLTQLSGVDTGNVECDGKNCQFRPNLYGSSCFHHGVICLPSSDSVCLLGADGLVVMAEGTSTMGRPLLWRLSSPLPVLSWLCGVSDSFI